MVIEEFKMWSFHNNKLKISFEKIDEKRKWQRAIAKFLLLP